MNHCGIPFPAHWFCWTGNALLVWLHTLSDSVIALSYFAIPAALFYLAHKYHVKRLAGVFKIYAIFIFGCGLTHVFDVVTVWYANYWIYLVDGIIRALTGIVSVAAAYVTAECARDALVVFTRLAVYERRMAERLERLEVDPRFQTPPDLKWKATLRELRELARTAQEIVPTGKVD